MKLTNKQIRQLIREELQNVIESQKDVGLPHRYTDLDLYQHVLNFMQNNPDLRNATPEVQEKGEKLLRILHNASQKAVTHHSGNRRFDHTKMQVVGTPETSPEETEQMRDVQAKLKMARNALANALPGHKYDYRGRSSSFGDMLRAADPTGEKQKSGLRPDQISDEYHDAIGRRYDDED